MRAALRQGYKGLSPQEEISTLHASQSRLCWPLESPVEVFLTGAQLTKLAQLFHLLTLVVVILVVLGHRGVVHFCGCGRFEESK